MASPGLSWASVASRNVASIAKPTKSTTHAISPHPSTGRAALQPTESTESPATPRTAFISGHIDITPSQFSAHYAAALDAAIRHGDTFVVSNSRGVDTYALAYLNAHNIDPSRITIYLHSPRPNQAAKKTPLHIERRRQGPPLEDRYTKEGYSVRVISGYHTERDAAMTEASDYDILWIRSESETAALYGSKYRPGRISGTQKNRERRLLKEQKATSEVKQAVG